MGISTFTWALLTLAILWDIILFLHVYTSYNQTDKYFFFDKHERIVPVVERPVRFVEVLLSLNKNISSIFDTGIKREVSEILNIDKVKEFMVSVLGVPRLLYFRYHLLLSFS